MPRKSYTEKYIDKSLKIADKLDDKPIWKWGKYEWLPVLSVLMVIFSVLPKYFSVQYWVNGHPDMTSYSDSTVACFLVSSALFIIVPYLQKNVAYLFLGIIGMLFTLVIVYFKYVYPIQPVL